MASSQITLGLLMPKLRLGNNRITSTRDLAATPASQQYQHAQDTPLRATTIHLAWCPRRAIYPRLISLVNADRASLHQAPRRSPCTGSRALQHRHTHQAFACLRQWRLQNRFQCHKVQRENSLRGRFDGGLTRSSQHPVFLYPRCFQPSTIGTTKAYGRR